MGKTNDRLDKIKQDLAGISQVLLNERNPLFADLEWTIEVIDNLLEDIVKRPLNPREAFSNGVCRCNSCGCNDDSEILVDNISQDEMIDVCDGCGIVNEDLRPASDRSDSGESDWWNC